MEKVNHPDKSLDFIHFFFHTQQAPQYSYNLYHNLAILDEVYIGNTLFDKFKAMPALISNLNSISSASLDTIKANNDVALLFGYDSGLNGFGQNSIFPHFGVGFDLAPVQEVRMVVHSCFETSILYNFLFNADAVKKIHARKLIVINLKDAIVKWFIDQMEIPIQTEEAPPEEMGNFTLNVVKRLGCQPIVNLDDKTSLQINENDKKNRGDLNNLIHTEIELCQNHAIKKEQVFSALEKWSASFESSLHVIFEILDYLIPLRDKLLIQHESIPEDLQKKLESLSQSLQSEAIYSAFIKNCEAVFENIMSRETKNIEIKILDTEKQNLLFLQHKIALYDFLKHNIGVHLQNCKKALHALQTRMEEKPYNLKKEEKFESGLNSSSYDFSDNQYKLVDPTQNIKYEEIFDDQKNKKPLCAREVYPNGSIKSELYYRGTSRHGPSSFYDPQGRLLAKGWFINDQQMGINEQYYSNGNLYGLQRYNKGEFEGKQSYYDSEGRLKTVLNFHQGCLEGEALLYHPNGQLKRRLSFKKGKRHGLEEMWYPNGVQELEAQYENDEPIGTIKNWHLNGHLAKQITFHKFPNEFDMTLWNEEGRILQSSTPKAVDAMGDLIRKTQNLKKLLDEATLNLIELINKKKYE